MRLSLKQMLWLWVAIIAMIGLLFGMAYQRFNKDILVDGFKKELERVYPNSVVKIGDISTSFLVDINLAIDEVSVEREQRHELSLNHLELKIPWWSLLMGSGRVQLNVEGLTLNLPQKKIQQKKSTPSVSSSSTPIQLSLPEYVLNSSLNIRIKDLELIDPDQNERRLKLSKVIIRDYKVGDKTAFELNIPLSIKWGGVYSGEIWVFGDFLSNGEKVDINWRADSRGFKQEEWNLNDLFIEGKGSWSAVTQNIDAKVSLIHSSKKISELDIKVTQERLSMTGPINQIPVEIIKPLIKQFHPRSELSYFKGSELGNGHFSWNYTWPGVSHHFDLRLGFEGDFYSERGIWSVNWMSESYALDFVSADKKLRYEGKWSEEGISHHGHLEGRNIDSKGLDIFNPFITYLYPVKNQKFSLSLHEVIWSEKLYSGTITLDKLPSEGSKVFSMKLKNDKAELDFNWQFASDASQKISLKASQFTLGPFGTYFHSSLANSSAVLNGKLDADWKEDLYQGKGSASLSIIGFSQGKASWDKYWDFIAKNFSLMTKPDQVNLHADWKAGLLKVKKLNVQGAGLKAQMTGKLDFSGKKSELVWQDQLSPSSKKMTQSFIIDEFMRSL